MKVGVEFCTYSLVKRCSGASDRSLQLFAGKLTTTTEPYSSWEQVTEQEGMAEEPLARRRQDQEYHTRQLGRAAPGCPEGSKFPSLPVLRGRSRRATAGLLQTERGPGRPRSNRPSPRGPGSHPQPRPVPLAGGVSGQPPSKWRTVTSRFDLAALPRALGGRGGAAPVSGREAGRPRAGPGRRRRRERAVPPQDGGVRAAAEAGDEAPRRPRRRPRCPVAAAEVTGRPVQAAGRRRRLSAPASPPRGVTLAGGRRAPCPSQSGVGGDETGRPPPLTAAPGRSASCASRRAACGAGPGLGRRPLAAAPSVRSPEGRVRWGGTAQAGSPGVQPQPFFLALLPQPRPPW